MKNILKRYVIKIPSEISVFYCEKSSLLFIQGKIGKKLLKLKTKIIILKKKNLIIVKETDLNKFKDIKKTLNTELALIKQAFLEVSVITVKKLKLVGVGFKVFNKEIEKKNFIHFKLGYSHDIFFKVPTTIKINILQSTIMVISGVKYNDVLQMASLLKKFKTPDPYKGKGILYSNESIKLKEGKKV